MSEDRMEALRAERDALAERCTAAEQKVAELTAELEVLRARLAEQESDSLSLFEGSAEEPRRGLRADGTDPRVLSLTLAATAVVAGMVALLALVNGNLQSPFGLGMIGLTLVLAYAAARARVKPVSVSVADGMVVAETGGSTYRFDLRSEATQVQVQGQPGDPYWQVRFLRRHLDPFVVDADMVDPREFMRKVREFRPEL